MSSSAFLIALASLVLVSNVGPQGERSFKRLALHGGAVLEYALSLPEGFQANESYPVLLALPQGAQDRAMVELGLDVNWDRAAKRGWVVVSPVAPEGKTFHEGSEVWIPALLDEIARAVHVEGGKFHLAGASNGGLSAFRVVLEYPERFASMTVLPGRVPKGWDFEKLGALKAIPVAMFVGGDDPEWLAAGKATHDALVQRGIRASFEVLPGQGHRLKIPTESLFHTMDAARVAGDPAELVKAVLVDFHDAAAKADEARYFDHFTPDAVFLGTDATERWTVDEFHDWVRKGGYFASGKGWTYVPFDQHVTVARDGNSAWFDERLRNQKIGECRGTGVLVRSGDTWRIAQYNLTVPLPNELTSQVTEMIRKHASGK